MFFCWVLQALLLLQCLNILKSSVADSTNDTTAVAPLVVPPSQRWEGNDGPWSSFFLRVGTPAQSVTVLISTASNQPLVVLPEGCSSSDPSNCASSRGGLFLRNASSTWVQNNETAQGIFALAIETNLNYSVNALYGSDTVALSYPGSGTPSFERQLVGGMAVKDIFMGVFGLNPASTNFSDYNNPIPSYMSTLKTQNKIPSLSYGYTAGNQYRFNKVLGSLTLGGYDASIVEPNELTVAFNGDSTRDLTINVNSISFSSGTGKKNLSTTWFPAFIDSTIPYLYLPLDVCLQFEEAFGIVYDNATGLYLVNDTLHSSLLSQAANVTFTLTNVTSQALVDITLPYQAFDLTADWPLVKQKTRYFPLKRAKDNSQTTLGRTFLQEAYIVADYERSNFSIYQRKWDANAVADIQPISPPGTADTAQPQSKSASGGGGKSHISTAVIIAIVVGGAVLLTVILGCILLIRQRGQKLEARKSYMPGPTAIKEPLSPPRSIKKLFSPTPTFASELDTNTDFQTSPELEGADVPLPLFASVLASKTSPRERIHELPANENVAELFGSPVYETPERRREREVQERMYIRRKQDSRRTRLIRNSP